MINKDDVIRNVSIILDALEAEQKQHGHPEFNEFGHPFDPSKDFVRGDRVITISLTKEKAVFDIYRAKCDPLRNHVSNSHFHHEIELTDA